MDHTKYHSFGFCVFARPGEFDVLITDDGFQDTGRFHEPGIEVLRAERKDAQKYVCRIELLGTSWHLSASYSVCRFEVSSSLPSIVPFSLLKPFFRPHFRDEVQVIVKVRVNITEMIK